jgi:hypothetical protein
MKLLFALLLIASVQLAINGYPMGEQLSVGDVDVDGIINNIPEDVKVDDLNDLLRRIAEIIFKDVRCFLLT